MMNNEHNRVNLLGSLNKKPELRRTARGSAACCLYVQTSDKHQHRVIVYGHQAEIIGNYGNQGDKVVIQGQLQTRQYEQNGQKKYITEVIVSESSGYAELLARFL